MVLVFIVLATCLFGATLAAISFLIPFETPEMETGQEAARTSQIATSRFFVDPAQAPGPESGIPHPLGSMLHQLEEHVRQEHAAAEAFLQGPSAESLHAPTQSSPWN